MGVSCLAQRVDVRGFWGMPRSESWGALPGAGQQGDRQAGASLAGPPTAAVWSGATDICLGT